MMLANSSELVRSGVLVASPLRRFRKPANANFQRVITNFWSKLYLRLMFDANARDVD